MQYYEIVQGMKMQPFTEVVNQTILIKDSDIRTGFSKRQHRILDGIIRLI